MRKSRKNHKKKNRTKKCVYTDEAKRLLKAIKDIKKFNKTRTNKTSKNTFKTI